MDDAKARFPASALIERGQQSIAAGDLEMGVKYLQKVLEQEPNNLEAVEYLGDVLMEMGDIENARILFKHSIEIDPNESGTKWMYLAQLQEGKEALQSFRKGISILTDALRRSEAAQCDDGKEQEALIKSQLCSGLCSIAELFMSDLCFEPDAEEQCDEVLQQALQYQPDSPEVLQCMASFRISQQRPEDAKTLMDRALNAQGIETARAEMVTSADQGMTADEDENVDDGAQNETGCPFEFRVTTARLLVELAQFAKAVAVLERLLREDDEVVEVWSLLAQCHLELKNTDVAKECIERADTMLKSFLAVDPEDEHFMSQLKRLEQLSRRLPQEQVESGFTMEME